MNTIYSPLNGNFVFQKPAYCEELLLTASTFLMINLHCGSRINPKEKAFWANFCKMMSVFNSYFRHNFSFFLSFLFFFCWVVIRKDFVKDESSQKTRNCVTHPAGILLDWKKDFRGSKKLVLDNVCKMKIKKPSGLGT